MVDISEPVASAFTEQDSDFQLSALVQSFPCIWDNEHHQYRCTSSRDEAWQQIAQDMDEGRSAEEYKQKWRRLRDKYALYLRECSNPVMNPSYFHLAQAMEFLKPYIRPRMGKGSLLHSVNQESNGGRHQQMSIAESDDDCELIEETSNSEWTTPTTSQNGYNNGGTEAHFAEEEESSGRFIAVDARNEDAMFLLSVLPKMRQMSAERKKLFKVSLLQACDQILK